MKNKKEKVILIADYGRSGQGWLSYMLSFVLNAKYIEPYALLKGFKYSRLQYVIDLTSGNLPQRKKTGCSMVIKTHEYPAKNFNLTDKVILLARDPRDVAVSAFWRYRDFSQKEKYESLKGKIFGLIHNFKFTSFIMTAFKWRKYYPAWENIGHHFVRYEDLSFNTKETLKNILKYLEVETPENLVKEAIEKFSFEKITGRKKGEEDLENLEFRKGIVGDHENYFSKLELKIFRFICGKEARKLGYIL